MYYIGTDLGTSSVKILLMDEKGTIVNSVSRPCTSSYPVPGWSEQDPNEWYGSTCDGIRELTKDIDISLIKAISFSGQMHGLVCLDESDRIIRPAILWNDGRTGEETDELNLITGRSNLIEYTSNIAFAGFTAPKLLWMKKNEPDLFSRIHKIMLPKDYLLYRLTGIHASDPSDASGTLLFDVRAGDWSEDMMRICDIKRDQLPLIYQSHEVVGTLTPQAAEATGLDENTLVVAGAADNAAAAIGTGTVGRGRCNISLGTSGTVFVTGDSFHPDPEIPVHCFLHADGGLVLLGCMLSAASCMQWWLEDILATTDYDSQTDINTGLGENDLYFLPYLMGERTPWNDPDIRGCFIGLSRDTSRSQMNQAIMEGVAFGIRDGIEAAKKLGANIDSSTICGGGSKNPSWVKIMSNVLGIPLTMADSEEGPGLGAAILAATGAGAFESIEEAVDKIVSYGETICPDDELTKKYEDRYARYRSMYPVIKELF